MILPAHSEQSSGRARLANSSPGATWMLCAALLLGPSVHADIIYKCEQDGQTTFSQHACAEDAEQIEEDDLSGLTGAGADIEPAAPIDNVPEDPEATATTSPPEEVDSAEASSAAEADLIASPAADSAEIARRIRRLEADAEQRISEFDHSRKNCIVELANNPPDDPDVNPNVLLQQCRNRWTRLSQKTRLETDEAVKALRAELAAQEDQ